MKTKQELVDEIDVIIDKMAVNNNLLLEKELKKLKIEKFIEDKTNEILLKTKQEWSELGITNEAGRKAFKNQELKSEKEELDIVKQQLMVFNNSDMLLNRLLKVKLNYIENCCYLDDVVVTDNGLFKRNDGFL